MKKKFVLLFFLALIFISAPIVSLKADSGWDSDYDSGFDSDWGSDFDSDYDYDSYGSSHTMTGFDLIVFMVIIIIILYALYNNSKKIINEPSVNKILSDNDIHSIDPTINIEELKKYTFELYKNVQEAWMNFDYNKLREYLSDELYNNYKMQLETLKIKNGKNIMEDITYINSSITDIKKTDNLESVVVMLSIRMKDYVIDVNSNKVIRGDKYKVTSITYLITLERNTGKSDKYCPNCGAEISDNASNTCPYCDSVIVKNTSKFIMTKKENIRQTWR